MAGAIAERRRFRKLPRMIRTAPNTREAIEQPLTPEEDAARISAPRIHAL